MSRVVFSVFDDIGNPHYGGGGARVTHEVAKRLAEHHDVTVYTSGYPASGRRAVRDDVEYRFTPTGWAGPRLGQLLFSIVISAVALVRRFDVWFETLTPPFGVSVLPLLRPGRVVGWAQLLPGRLSAERYRLPFDRVERFGLRWYRRMVVLNESDATVVLDASPPTEVWVIPNGVAVPPGEATTALASPAYLLYLGRIDVYTKGLDLLIQAHRRARNPFPLVIAGSGTARDEAQLRALLPDDGSVRLLGKVEGEFKERLLRGCAGVLMPSRVETFGLVALEAMAHGKRVVTFDLPTLDWLAPSGRTTVRAFDVDGLAHAIEQLSEPQTLQDAERSIEFARRFDWEIAATRYAAVVGDVTGASNRRSARRDPVRRHA